MSDIAVRVENLGKCYQIGQAKSGDFRESFGSWMDKLRGGSNGRQEESKKFWALKDINFEIKKGEAVGIIGRNGAGKSTLLKILSRITEPTKGRFEINGRVSSLLEVGTGFHPELSGRENIYLNGTILGMKRREIKAKFDEIVAFSGVGKFIDTPVKHYSSGMKVRLAFSVAAHLEPEILIIDEVLAVGDAEFQKKCLGKMDEVSRNEGRTVIFVSHNLGAVEALCTAGIIIDHGMLALMGSANKTITYYLNNLRRNDGFSEDLNVLNLSNHVNKKYNKNFGLLKVEAYVNGKPSFILSPGDHLKLRFYYKLENVLTHPVLGVVIKSPFDEPFIGVNNNHTAERLNGNQMEGVINVDIPKFSIYGIGKCGVDLYFGDNEDNFDTIIDAFFLDLRGSDMLKSGVFVNPALNKVYQPNISFSIENE